MNDIVDIAPEPHISAQIWLGKFVKYKLNTLSGKFVGDAEALLEITLALDAAADLAAIERLAKRARNLGLIGINTYFNPLKKLCKALEKLPLRSLKDFDEIAAASLLAAITAGLSDASKKNHRTAVVSFFRFISEFNAENFMFKIRLKNWGGIGGTRGQKLPEYMDEQQLRRFLEVLESFEFKSHALRNRLLIKIILFSGVRVSEALYLRVRDITLVDNIYQIRIHGKGNKYRVVMVSAHSISAELIELCGGKLPGDYLFESRSGRVLTQAFVSRIIEQVLLAAGIRKEKNGAHMLRHSFATLLYQKSKDLLLVQEALGHASVETSRIYTHFDSEKLRLAADIARGIAEDK